MGGTWEQGYSLFTVGWVVIALFIECVYGFSTQFAFLIITFVHLVDRLITIFTGLFFN